VAATYLAASRQEKTVDIGTRTGLDHLAASTSVSEDFCVRLGLLANLRFVQHTDANNDDYFDDGDVLMIMATPYGDIDVPAADSCCWFYPGSLLRLLLLATTKNPMTP
jgi:hypothetical protein